MPVGALMVGEGNGMTDGGYIVGLVEDEGEAVEDALVGFGKGFDHGIAAGGELPRLRVEALYGCAVGESGNGAATLLRAARGGLCAEVAVGEGELLQLGACELILLQLCRTVYDACYQRVGKRRGVCAAAGAFH